MGSTVRVRTAVLPGGRVEVADPDLRPGDEVEVIILSPPVAPVQRKSALEILEDAPGGRLLRSAEEVDAYLREERDSWER